ncbi:MAG: DUF4349 domain-containing protein [Actinobacteria bacterium]|nr:DUF4349 domain-containing protein [Actinomycetota bacterium]
MPTTTPRARARLIGAVLAAALLATGCASSDEGATSPEPVADGVDAGGGEAAETEAAAGDDAMQALEVGVPLGRKVVFRAHVSLEADDTQAAITDIRRAVERVGGFVATAAVRRGEDDQLRGTLTLRVPSSELDTTLDALRAVGDRVVEERIDSDDVTEEFADVEAQLRNLRALETELLSLLAEVRDKSDNAEQILAVFERIRQVRGEIEQLEGRRQVLDDLVSLATVEVSIEPTSSATPLASDEWRPGDVVRSAVRTTVAALRTVVDVAIWLTLTVLPVALVVIGVPLVIGLALRRSWRRRQDSGTRPVDVGDDRATE